jgi:1,4-alpha-glucan branching enzyme
MSGEVWKANVSDVEAIVGGRHGDPFAVLGPHPVKGGFAVRVFVPTADTIRLVDSDGAVLCELEKTDEAGFFEGLLKRRRGVKATAPAPRYRVVASNAGGSWDFLDAYAFGPVLGPLDDHLLVEGTHRRLYERLGAQIHEHEGVPGVAFAVWAPNASRVSVVGDFNAWDGRRHQMRKRVDSGIWEIFVPEIGRGAVYKYEIVSADGRLLPLKADPFGFGSELRPSTASVVEKTDDFSWTDAEWMAKRGEGEPRRRPMSIYEVHLGSWQRGDWNRFLTYDELAERLIPYVRDLGFTHLELLPINEHPLDASWGYQPIGLFSPSRRFGDPAGFARFVDAAHAAGLGVIIDWVPAHFPTDQQGLREFDGAPLYEYADPRRGFHPDWNTAIYDFGRKEVVNFLIASALYWLDRFHVDGLRVDAVASMLYLDYSRKDGEWLPNEDGGRDNREAVAFLKRFNALCYELFPGVVTIAEESTAWAGVSLPVDVGGLGFGFKWNMGWMHDTLDYMAREAVHRRWHHEEMTFGLLYAFAENFILPISHDEVVHGKGSMIQRMSGDHWQKFAGLRAFYAFMWSHPGKKLLFMGQEFAQWDEWKADFSLDWHLTQYPDHNGMQRLVGDLNRIYRTSTALYARDCEGEGFRWVVVEDRDQSVFAYLRLGGPDDPPVLAVINFTPVPRENYRIGLPSGGRWREILNTDAAIYGGTNFGNDGAVWTDEVESHGLPVSALVRLPPLGAVYFEYQGE